MSVYDSDVRVYETISALGIPGAHYAYPEGGAPKPPFFVYSLDDGGECFCDDLNYAELPRYRVQLLEKEQDAELEKQIAVALQAEFGPTKVYEDWSQSEHARLVSWYFTVTD